MICMLKEKNKGILQKNIGEGCQDQNVEKKINKSHYF